MRSGERGKVELIQPTQEIAEDTISEEEDRFGKATAGSARKFLFSTELNKEKL